MNLPASMTAGLRLRCSHAREAGWAAGLAALAGGAPVEAAGDGRGLSRLHATVVREALLPGTPAEVFDYIAGEGVLPELLTGWGPLPAVTGTSEVSGPWSVPGSHRIVHTADGHTICEQVVLFERPRRFAYRLWDFSHPLLGRLADDGSGDWTFAEARQGTRVRWTYAFGTGSRPKAAALSLMAGWLWTGYMDTCLDNARRILSSRR